MLCTLKIYIQAVGQSFFNAPLFTQVVKGTQKPWTGYGFAYGLVLAALLSLFSVGQLAVMAYSFGQHTLPKLTAQVPSMVINNGEIAVQVPQPHKIMLDNKPLIVINTNAKIAEAKLSKAPIFITKDTIYLLKSSDNREAKFIDKKLNGKFDGALILKTWHTIMPWGLVFVWPLMLLGGWIMLLGQGFLVALGSYVITAFMPEEFDFGNRLRMALVALTPPLLLQLLVSFSGQFYLNGLTVVALALLYFYALLRVARAA
jgi:hypothetical protein